MFTGEQNHGGEAAIGRVPVVSANGERLMPCKPAKARKLLMTGKAFKKRMEDGTFYVKLRFNPSSTTVRPSTGSVQESGSNSASNMKSRDALLNNGFDSSYLRRVRREAKRNNVWFRSLCKGDRDILELTIKCVDQPKSPKLILALARIVVKIKKALMSPLYRLIEEIGRPLTKKMSQIAKSWGYRAAGEWVEDEGFVKYLTIVDMNNIPGFRLSDVFRGH